MMDITNTLVQIGALGIFVTIILETGTPFGVFLPGDSLLFTVGILASKGLFNIWYILPLFFVAGVIGNELGYTIGKKFGPKLFEEDGKYFKKEHLIKTKLFLDKYGVVAVIIGRFIPIVRTVIASVAGVGNMNHWTFTLCNIFGSLIWAVGMPLLGYIIGERVQNAEKYIIPIALSIIFVSLLPIFKEWWKSRHEKAASATIPTE